MKDYDSLEVMPMLPREPQLSELCEMAFAAINAYWYPFPEEFLPEYLRGCSSKLAGGENCGSAFRKYKSDQMEVGSKKHIYDYYRCENGHTLVHGRT